MQPFEKKSIIGDGPEGRIVVRIKWDGKNLSLTGDIGRDHGGQIVGSPWDIATYAEGVDAETVEKLRTIWKTYHLNDMQAGSPAQTAYLKSHPIENRADFYNEAVAALTRAGINPDASHLHNGKPYQYGTAWLRIEVPADVVQWLQALP